MRDRFKAVALLLPLTYILLISLCSCYKTPPQQPYRIEELNRLVERAGRLAEKGDIERAISLYKDALMKARLLQDDRLTLIILISLSRLLTSRAYINEAEELIKTARSLVEPLDSLNSRAEREGPEFFIPQDIKEELYLEEIRIAYLKKDLKTISEREDIKKLLLNSRYPSIRIRALNLFGAIAFEQQRYEESEGFLIESLRINEKISLLERANTHRLLGELYARSQRLEAVQHLLEALRIDKRLALPEKIGLDLELLGRFYKDRGDRQKARQYLQRALEVWQLRADERLSKVKELLMELGE